IVRLAERLGDRDIAYQAHLLRELALFEAGEIGAAKAELDAAARLADELKLQSLQAEVMACRSRRAWLAGDFAAADRLNAEAMEQALAQGGDPELVMLTIGGQAMAQQLLRHDLQPFVSTLQDFAAQYPQHGIIR